MRPAYLVASDALVTCPKRESLTCSDHSVGPKVGVIESVEGLGSELQLL